ncbi:MAG: heme biosynthesis protein HemY [Oxalobacteraceae bacterium]|nr:heme biosynthesis protein HemY [Oxalobacteraceae bacterium]
MTTRFFLWLVGLFASAIGLALLARFNPGNVVLFYPPHRIDISLNFFIVILLLSFLLLLLIVNTVRATMALPRRVEQYRAMRQLRESGRALKEALRAYFEGRFGRVEKSARKAAQSPEYAGLAALLGARAAQRLQEPSRRDQWLGEAAADHSLRTARLMSAVDLLSEDNKDLDAALAALHELSSSGIRHAHALRLALKVNQSARNWPEVLRLVYLLEKHNALHPTLSRRLRDMAYEALLPKAAEDAESLKKLWATIPMLDRQSATVATLGATAFMKIGRQQDAADILQKALSVQWDVRLLRAYRQCAAPEGSATLLSQIEHVEQWLRDRPNDAELALLLGALCQKQKLWGKAQRHLEQAVLGASDRITLQEAHLRLAQMYEVLGQPEAATTHFRLCALTTQVPNSKSSQ